MSARELVKRARTSARWSDEYARRGMVVVEGSVAPELLRALASALEEALDREARAKSTLLSFLREECCEAHQRWLAEVGEGEYLRQLDDIGCVRCVYEERDRLRAELARREAAGLAEVGLSEWAAGLPQEDTDALVDPRSLRPVRHHANGSMSIGEPGEKL